jgi:hypothetical protein
MKQSDINHSYQKQLYASSDNTTSMDEGNGCRCQTALAKTHCFNLYFSNPSRPNPKHSNDLHFAECVRLTLEDKIIKQEAKNRQFLFADNYIQGVEYKRASQITSFVSM